MFEKDFLYKDLKYIAATDEVGRGPLAGPVVSSCVHVKADEKSLIKLTSFLREFGVTDSKKLTDKKREKILNELGITIDKSLVWAGELAGVDLQVSIDKKSPAQIDKLNILQASLVSMRDAYKKFHNGERSLVLVDGNKKFKDILNVDIEPVVKGDSKSSLIGLASIVAKVFRDQLMKSYAKKYPHYGFEKNAGYPTKVHREAIVNHGITPIHRKSFKGVKEFIDEQSKEGLK